jgi:hypothetical protein
MAVPKLPQSRLQLRYRNFHSLFSEDPVLNARAEKRSRSVGIPDLPSMESHLYGTLDRDGTSAAKTPPGVWRVSRPGLEPGTL